MHRHSTGYEFEIVVIRALVAKDFVVVDRNDSMKDRGFDFIARRAHERWAVEVKFYRTSRAQGSLLETAASRLSTGFRRERCDGGILVVSCILPLPLRETLETTHGISILDRSDLLLLAAATPVVLDALSALFESSADVPAPPHDRSSELKHASTIPHYSVDMPDATGSRLCTELRALKRGKGTWTAYEKLCERILRYLFPNDLHGWHRQARTDDGINRYDFVCRIRSSTDFWKFLVESMNSRYVVFEFKNYTGQITQGQILTTEKYLLEKALRRVAFIITRVGGDAHAIAMTQGAMREHGKLMLIVTDDRLCTMLHMKERGEDPTDSLFDLADSFLLTLPR